jgi:hypothetical protein
MTRFKDRTENCGEEASDRVADIQLASLSGYAMLTYVYFGTNDLERATRCYDATLTLLGMQRSVTGDPAWDRLGGLGNLRG